jgi:hypothetical protein
MHSFTCKTPLPSHPGVNTLGFGATPQESWIQGLPLRVGLLRVSLALHPRKRGQALHIPKPVLHVKLVHRQT